MYRCRVSKMEKKYMLIIGVLLAVTIIVVLIFTFLPKKNTQNFEYVDDENTQCNIPRHVMNMSTVGKIIEVKNKNKSITVNEQEFTIKLSKPSTLLQLVGNFENLKISVCDENLMQLLYLYRQGDDLIVQTGDMESVQTYEDVFYNKKVLIISHLEFLKIDNKHFISNKLDNMKYLLVTAPKKITEIKTTPLELLENLT